MHPQALQALDILSVAFERLPLYFGESVTNALLTTPLLHYFGAISCAFYLVEHAIWSLSMNEPMREVDVEAFRRWVEEGDLAHTQGQIAKAREDYHGRKALDSKMVYGVGDVTAKL